MLSYKLTTTMAASIYAHKPQSHHHHHQNLNNLFRTITSKRKPSSKTNTHHSSIVRAAKPCSLDLNGNRERIPAIYKDGWWRLTTCAHLVCDKIPPKKVLGFRGPHKKSFSLGCKPSTRSEEKEELSRSGSGFRSSDSSGSSSSLSSGSGFVSDMGSESKENQAWYDDDLQGKTHLPSSLTQQNQEQSSKLLTLPTILTLGRVCAVPLLVCTFYVDSWWGTTATTSVFIVAAITDWLDGYLARKMRLGSAFGAFLDPVADKLMVAATLVLLCTKPLDVATFGEMPWLLTAPSIAIIGREITMSAVREWAASQNSKLLEAVAVNNLGKWKTATQMISLTILLATRDSSLGAPGILVASGVVLLYLSAGLAVWSLAVYMRKISKVLLR